MKKKVAISMFAAVTMLESQQNRSLSDILNGGAKKGAVTPPRTAPKAAKMAASAGKGFRMQLPPGWRAELTENQAVVARSGDGASTILIGPVMAPPELRADDFLRRYGAIALKSWFPDASMETVVPSRLGRTGALASIQFRSSQGPGRGAALFFVSGGVGTLYAIGAPAVSFTQQQSQLIQALRSFSFDGAGGTPESGGETRSGTANLSYTRFTDPYEGSFSLDIPAGWRTQGGLIRKTTVDARVFVRVTSPDGATTVFMGDPNVGTFVTPTQTLAMSGIREGGQYSAGYGSMMMVRRYVPGLQFAQEYAALFAQQQGATGLQARDARQRPDLTGVQNGIAQEAATGGEISFSCTLRGREGAGYVLAGTKLTSMYGMGMWNVIALTGYLAPVEQVNTAAAVAQHMVRSVQINPRWFAQQQRTTGQTVDIVTETNARISQIITDSYWSRQRVQDRANQNFSDSMRGTVRFRDPQSGEELEGRGGNNYYWRVRGTDTVIGNDTGTPPPQIDVTELEQIR